MPGSREAGTRPFQRDPARPGRLRDDPPRRTGRRRPLGQRPQRGGRQQGSDLATATRLVAAAHASYGLGGSLAWLGSEDEAMQMVRLDPNFRHRVEADLTALQKRADALVAEHAVVIDAVARRLATQRVMAGEEVRQIIAAMTVRGATDLVAPRDT